MRTLSSDDRCRALVEAEGNTAGYARLCHADEGIVGLTLGRPPTTLVDEVRITRSDEILGRERPTIEHELLELRVGRV